MYLSKETAVGETGIGSVSRVVETMRQGLRRVIQGRDETVDLILTALLADGHVLLEDHPGSGKTTLARTMGELLVSHSNTLPTFRRIQFTPDLLPTDITGVSIFEPATGTFRFRQGPLFAHIVLADEINRTSPKVQAALLEAMAEKQVTAEEQSLPLDPLFMVIATQNPYDGAGTYPLPAAQLDRFLFKIRMDYLGETDELTVLKTHEQHHKDHAPIFVTRDEILAAREWIRDNVFVSDRVQVCLVETANRLRAHARVLQGPSTRSLILMTGALKALAAMEEREYVSAEDVRRLAGRVFGHRIVAAGGTGRNASAEIGKIVSEALSEPLEKLVRSTLTPGPVRLVEESA